MNTINYDGNCLKFFQERMILSKKKCSDYADDDDYVGNFKRMAQLCEILRVDTSTPAGCALFLKLLKIDRIQNIIHRRNEIENESLRDSFLDEANYSDLWRECLLGG